MIRTLVVTHGQAAESLIDTCKRIVGARKHLESYCVDWDADIEDLKVGLRNLIQKSESERGVLILTDLFGGTPTNIALAFHDPGRVEVITGVNLPMIMKAMTLPKEMDVTEAARVIKTQAQKAIYVASELL